MDTSASSLRLRQLLTAIRNESLIPQPEFQRRLVWTNKHKHAFIKTVLEGLPFPEIYIAAGEINTETGEGIELLVDGQQRLTTLYQYFTGSPELKLPADIPPYSELGGKQTDFLEYKVVIRDLGKIANELIVEIFTRINSTNYALNAMEIHNARYDGALKKYAETVAQSSFFEEHSVFHVNAIRRMHDTLFVLTFIVTIVSTYFARDSEIENYLKQYNDEFIGNTKVDAEIKTVFKFIDACDIGSDCRAWQQADLLTLLVEVHRAIIKNKKRLNPQEIGKRLVDFYSRVDKVPSGEETNREVIDYHTAALQASNDRTSRTIRGNILLKVILDELHKP